jgi:hypothetical protein
VAVMWARHGWRPGWLAGLLALLLMAGLVPVVGLASAAEAAGGDGTPQEELLPGPLSRGREGDLVARTAEEAVAAAEAAGEPVVIDELTDEYTRHFANPDGTRSFEQYVAAQRVRRDAGWVPLDTTLRMADGRVVPAATVLDMSFSAGGSGELVTVADGDVRLGLSWPGNLPEPELDGDEATYPEVMPGVDLVVRAEAESFAQMLVVKTRQAAANPALSRLVWGVSTEGVVLRTSSSGVVEARDNHGEVVFAAPEPLMWDSPPTLSQKEAALIGVPGSLAAALAAEPGVVRSMPVEADGGELAVRPDRAVLSDPGTTYPVMIDPSFSKQAANWAPVNKADPNRSYPSGSSWPRDTVRVGATWGSPQQVWRSHLRFGISSMDGQDLVGKPSFLIRLDHSASCASTPVELWRTSTIGSSGNVTWNGMKGKWLHGGPLATRSAHANEAGGCGGIQPDVDMEFSNSNIRSRLQAAMDNGNSTFTFGLRAPNESDQYQWKRFTPGTAKLTAVYNLKPVKPTNLAITSNCYPGECASPAMVRTRRPTLKAKVRDPNGDKMRVQFEVRNSTKKTVMASTTAVTNVSSGSSPTWRTPTLPQEKRYYFRVRAKDSVGWGPWSGYYEFFVDTQAPATPLVSGDPYTHKDTGEWNGGAGQPGSFAFDPNGANDVIAYQWRINGGSVTTENVSAGAGYDAEITPLGELEQLLEVRSIDHAGNASAWRPYPFYVRPQPVDVAYWKFDEGSGTTAGTTSGEPAYAGTLYGGASWAASEIGLFDPGASGTAVSLDGTDDYVEMPRVVATSHAAGFSVSAWVRPDALAGYQTVVAQHGAQTYAFRLYYRAVSDQWCFRVMHDDDPAASGTMVCSALAPQAGVWTHLAGVYDRPAGMLRLYVNGGPNVFDPELGPGTMDEVPVPALWASTGSFAVGRRLTQGAEWWAGRIDEVRAYQRVLLDADVQEMFLSCRLGTCPTVAPATEPVLVGEWNLDEGTGTVAADTSGLAGTGTLVGGAAWATGYGDGSAVSFDGVSGAVETDGPVLLTDESFTVSAWARLDDLSENHAIVSQDGEVTSPFRLDYDPNSAAWCFRRFDADQAGPSPTKACGGSPQVGQWNHLVGVYDAAALELRLYVGGQLAATETFNDVAWRGEGALTIGRTLYAAASGNVYHDFFAGRVDLVRAYQGAMTGTQVGDLYDEQLDLTPTAVIDSPSTGLQWAAGDEIAFSGHADDPQGALPPTAMTWRLWLVDCSTGTCQRELVDEVADATSGSFTAPDVAETPVQLELELVADGPGGTDTAVVQLDPLTVDLTFATDPAALELTVGSESGVAPFTRTVIQGASLPVEALETQEVGGDSYALLGWSDGGDPAHVITVPASAAQYTATYGSEADLQPAAVIDDPSGSALWTVGDEVAFAGHASDGAGAMPATALSWELRMVDCTVSPCQTEVLDDWQGTAGGTFTAPDVEYPAHLELELTADAGSGYTDSAVVQLDPATVDLSFESTPAGLELAVNSTVEAAPFTRTVIQGSAVEVEAIEPQDSGGTSYEFDSWSGGGARSHVFTAPGAAATYTADFVPATPGVGCGTDTYGYTCEESTGSFLPTTDVLPLTGDDDVVAVPLPFAMQLYGQVYDTGYVDTNGFVTFLEPEWPAASVAPIPSEYAWGMSNAAIYGFWADLLVDPSAAVRTAVVGTAPERQFVIEWDNVLSLFDQSRRVSFQVVLHETGEISMTYDDIDPAVAWERGSEAVVGIENADGTDALAFSQFAAVLADGMEMTFTPPAPGGVSGVVTDAGTGQPVANALVELNPSGQSTVTDAAGAYGFTDVPPGEHAVVPHRDDGLCAGPASVGTVSVASGVTASADVTVGSGVDSFGYTCTEGAREFLPTTDVLPLEGYYGNTQVTLPFPVTLYRQEYTTAWVDIEGAVSFQEPVTGMESVSAIPSPTDWGKPNAAVYPFWNNWIVIQGASIRTGTVGTAPDRQFVVEWRDVIADDEQFPARVSFQVVFHERGQIAMAWDGIDASFLTQGATGVVGIENADGTEALVYSQFEPMLSSGQGVEFGFPDGNLALGAAVTGDAGDCGSGTAALAVNGSWTGGSGDRWCSSGSPAWLEVDLGEITDIGSITLRHAGSGGEDPALNTQDFTLRVSEDGATWQTVADVTGNTADVTFHDVAALGRYARIDVSAPNSGVDGYTRIYEIEVYG